MSISIPRPGYDIYHRKEVIDFTVRPACTICNDQLIICSHSTPSRVIGFNGTYYTEYREYTCSNFKCPGFNKKKYRAPNPWRVDRHKYDLEVEAKINRFRFKETKTYREIKEILFNLYGIKISQKTIGNIISRYEISSKLDEKKGSLSIRENIDKLFISIDTMAPIKGEEKHIVAIDHHTGQTLLVKTVKSENTNNHIEFQQKLKKYISYNKIELLGFMSDDHRAQRNAIKIVWGDEMKHCRCLFHFEKRIMLEPFKLNSRLKTKAKAQIRNIHYVKLFREENLKLIKKSKVWDYLYDIIKDLTLLQNWKNKRNDTRLESIDFYERLRDIGDLLIELEKYISEKPKILYKRERVILKIMLREVKKVLNVFHKDYNTLKRIRRYQDNLRAIFEAHKESSEKGFEKLLKYTKILESKVLSEEITSKEEVDYITQLYRFVYDRGEALFYYRDIENASNTNNIQESKFKKIKHDIKRTQGASVGGRYLQRHAKYQLYVDPNATREEIKRILMNADYKEVARIMKEDRELYKREITRIKDKEKWINRIKQIKENIA